MWKIFCFSNHCKPHVMRVSGEATEAVIHDLANRGHEVTSVENINETHLDLPGMVISGRPWETVEMENLSIDVPSEHVQYFMSYMSTLKDRGGYYKIHSWNHCLVLSPADFFTFLGKLETALPTATKRDEEFFTAWKAKFGKKDLC